MNSMTNDIFTLFVTYSHHTFDIWQINAFLLFILCLPGSLLVYFTFLFRRHSAYGKYNAQMKPIM